MLVGTIWYGIYLFGWEWTGFIRFEAVSTTRQVPGSTPPISVTTDVVAGKTLWDWLDLLLIPVVLAGGAFWLNRRKREAERERAGERRRDDSLRDYLDIMTELILDRGLPESQPDDSVRDLARARTLSVLRVLDSARNQTVLQFLKEAKLFESGEAVIVSLAKSTLAGVDLRYLNFEKIDLRGIDLSRANLSGANLSQAGLSMAVLNGANLGETNLREAHLIGVELRQVNLSRADLRQANLSGADLRQANLSGADLSQADLCEADLCEVNLRGANLGEIDLTGAKYDPTTLWPDGFDPTTTGAVLDQAS